MAFVLPHDIIDGALATPSRTAFLLHGILGSRRNWRTFARRLARHYPEWRFVTVDLRGHGDAHGSEGPHTIEACAYDLARLGEHLGGPPRIVVGHSFGGKIALQYAGLFPTALDAVWSLDSPPGPWQREIRGSEISQLIAAIRSLPMPAENRVAVGQHFIERGFGRGVSGWMTTNVRRDKGGIWWRFDLDIVMALLEDYAVVDVWEVVETPPAGVSPHILVAGRGARWSSDDRRRLARAPRATFHPLPESGHWVHVDDPDGLVEALGASFGHGETADSP